ncbi:MAG: ABC transporter ATP-binding protein [Clostridiales bacterium]|nr:ABC transporter ATP-binding protein [Clostridiales bacterium]
MGAHEHAYAIEIEGAAKRYGGRSALSAVTDVSVHVGAGRVHGLLGPNGAGKTTTLKMLLGLVRPSAGTFRILGQSAGPAARAHVGFLPEQPYFPPLLNSTEVLMLHGTLCGMSAAEIESRSAELLRRVGVAGREKAALSTFSRGMLQRVGIAQALVSSPRVVVLDEPASGLDPVGQRDVRDLILELRDAGTTVLLSSHQLSEVEAVCDEVTILNRGRVSAKGRIDDLLNVAGRTSVRTRGSSTILPAEIQSIMEDVAVSGSVWVFSVPDAAVRAVVDILDDGGWVIESIVPKRQSLEEYFSRMLAETEKDAPFGAGSGVA